MAEKIIKSEMTEGDTIQVEFEKDKPELKITIIKPAVPPPPAKTGERKRKEEIKRFKTKNELPAKPGSFFMIQ
jgi:hypothetical protein